MSDEIKPATFQDQPPNSTGYPGPVKPPPTPAAKRPLGIADHAEESKLAHDLAVGTHPDGDE